jgi:hypothetical protein
MMWLIFMQKLWKLKERKGAKTLTVMATHKHNENKETQYHIMKTTRSIVFCWASLMLGALSIISSIATLRKSDTQPKTKLRVVGLM